MIRTATPAPSPELADAVTEARNALDRALDVPAGKIPRAVIDGRFDDYSTACIAAGAHPPIPWADWPPRPANATPKPPTRTRVAPAKQRSYTAS